MTAVAPPLSADSIMMESSCFSDRRVVFSTLEILLFGTFDFLIALTYSLLSWIASLVRSDLHASSVATMMSFVGMRAVLLQSLNHSTEH